MKNEFWYLAFRTMVNISGWIAFPVIFGLYFGKWLDSKFSTEPWLFLVTTGICFLLSVYGLTRSVLKEFKLENKDYSLPAAKSKK